MNVDVLKPSLDLLTQEYLIVQAWKKTASFIRRHNWYSDTLELDRTAVNLPHFLAELAEKLSAPEEWVSDLLRIVPAPKSQQWRIGPKTKRWEPVEKGKTGAKLRPLAHVSLKDQVATTAVMLCLADRIETLQGDPRASIEVAENRKLVLSYGNRLFCDTDGPNLRHRWGSNKLYRSYYQDYRLFLQRPEIVAKTVNTDGSTRIVVVHSDLRQFYDRVRPQLLTKKLEGVMRRNDDPGFFSLMCRILNWKWSPKDSKELTIYAKEAELSDFSSVALPQGLVAAGFLANLVLLDFDESLRAIFSKELAEGIVFEDACRYVDDLRIVLKVTRTRPLVEVEDFVAQWLQSLLDVHAEGLLLKPEKTRAALFSGDERLLVRQSRKMRRIQSAVSGGFDAIGGIEILDAIQGLIRSQERYSEQRKDIEQWTLAPIADVRDETVARFAAARYRSTYRSLRPLLADAIESKNGDYGPTEEEDDARTRGPRTKSELDDDVRAFALGLIENWVKDPSNVRLLRIGLDLWPAQEVLRNILDLLRPFTEKGGQRKAPRRVARYCLSEIFRAGAIETGFVEDNEALPAGVDIRAYREVLLEEAERLVSMPSARLPWYLKQQILLFLAMNDPDQAPILRTGLSPETKHYRALIRFLKGKKSGLKGVDSATLCILTRRSFRGREAAIKLAMREISAYRFEQIAQRDPSFALELLEWQSDFAWTVSPRIRNDLCLASVVEEDGWKSLASIVLELQSKNPIRNELTLLSFALQFLEAWRDQKSELITPSEIRLKLRKGEGGTVEVDQIQIAPSQVAPAGSMYLPPTWCPEEEKWRFHLGYLLRFILTAKQDFTRRVQSPGRMEEVGGYRAPESHWYQRLYGLYNGHSAFGDDWLPISDWIEGLLLALLAWPGCRTPEMPEVNEGIDSTCDSIRQRLRSLSLKQGTSKNMLILPVTAPRLDISSPSRPLRVCIVQTVIPTLDDLSSDLTLSSPTIRRRHRNHLSAALAAIERMLDLRETHKGREGRLDWLILPELSVHPNDVRTHLVPFARAHRAIILAGLTYQELFLGEPLVNSALWVIPVWSAAQGLQIRTYRQGKQYLAPQEQSLNTHSVSIQGFRPCQWLIGYDWSRAPQTSPLWLTAAICYDATDLSLAADLRDQSDVFAIPAFNRDVTTFDQMALALHYHMFQLVIVANNGEFGGSNAYAPYREEFQRQILHLHGQPQATVAFLEIDDIAAFLRRRADALAQSRSTPNPTGSPTWKFPPAGQ